MFDDKFIAQMMTSVGQRNVLAVDDQKAANHRAAIPADAKVACVVRPNTVNEIQAILRLANDNGFGVGVMPNHAGNGMSQLRADKESVLLDLSRLNDIIEVDIASGYTLLEPGVSFDQLQAHLQARKAPYWIDADANGANSVSGSVFERASGYTAYGDHLLMQCGMEVVLANGEVMRTGMGALPGSDTWQLFKYNYGPYLDGLFSRANFGVITKLGLWLMPAPPAYKPFAITLPKVRSVAAAVETLRPLKIGMVVPNTVAICDAAADRALMRAARQAPTDDYDDWTLYGALYGTPENLEVTWNGIVDGLRDITKAEVYTEADPPPAPAWSLRVNMMRGMPAYRATAAHIGQGLWFAASAPMEAEAVKAMIEVVDELDQRKLRVTREFRLGWRAMFMHVNIETREKPRNRPNLSLVKPVLDKLSRAGFAISHDCHEIAGHVEAHHIDTGLLSVYEALGQALDPNAVLGSRGDH